MTTQGQQYYQGTGRRKTAIAQVRIFSGGGAVVVNGEPIEEAFPMPYLRNVALEPLRVTGNLNRYNAVVKIAGGGVSAQAGALSHGLARALLEADPNYRLQLRKFGLLTRDPREKERRKYGLRKARKAKQYTKR